MPFPFGDMPCQNLHIKGRLGQSHRRGRISYLAMRGLSRFRFHRF